MHGLWKERTSVLFSKVYLDLFSFKDRIFKSCQQHKLSQRVDNIDEASSSACYPSEERSFNAANQMDFKGIIIFTDAGWIQGRATQVGVAQYKGSIFLLWLMNCSSSSTAQAEWRSLALSSLAARFRGWRQVLFCSDALNITSAIVRKQSSSWDCKAWIHDFLISSYYFNFWESKWLSSDHNTYAHNLCTSKIRPDNFLHDKITQHDTEQG